MNEPTISPEEMQKRADRAFTHGFATELVANQKKTEAQVPALFKRAQQFGTAHMEKIAKIQTSVRESLGLKAPAAAPAA